MTDFSNLLELLDLQLWYFKRVISKRNDNSDRAMLTPISSLIEGSEHRSPLQLAYHAINPLFQMVEILKNKKLQWDEPKLEQLGLTSSSKEFLELYEMVLNEAKKALYEVELNNFVGNMIELNNNEALFRQRLSIFCMHAMNHMAQAIKFQGLICENI